MSHYWDMFLFSLDNDDLLVTKPLPLTFWCHCEICCFCILLFDCFSFTFCSSWTTNYDFLHFNGQRQLFTAINERWNYNYLVLPYQSRFHTPPHLLRLCLQQLWGIKGLLSEYKRDCFLWFDQCRNWQRKFLWITKRVQRRSIKIHNRRRDTPNSCVMFFAILTEKNSRLFET